MRKKSGKLRKKGSSSLNKLSLFQKGDSRFSKRCPCQLKMHQ